MYPRKHFTDLEKSSRKEKSFHLALMTSAFLLSLFVIGPLIHEATHAAVLLWENCRFTADLGWNMAGFRANIKPLCSIGGRSLAFFYLSGYTATVLAGAALEFSATNIEEYRKTVLSAALGLLLSVAVSAGWRGDIANALEVMGYGSRLVPVLVVGILVTLYFGLESLELLLSEWQE
ncbi:MAG: hypothetical protein ABEJ98_02245 [Candidatus Nanohaloarchaea archaeon]